jgi:hypothetical protein
MPVVGFGRAFDSAKEELVRNWLSCLQALSLDPSRRPRLWKVARTRRVYELKKTRLPKVIEVKTLQIEVIRDLGEHLIELAVLEV